MATLRYTTTRRERKFNKGPEMKLAIEDVLNKEVKPPLLRSFRNVMVNWETKIPFKGRTSQKPDSVRLRILPFGSDINIWRWVSRGTKPHIIRARRAPQLVFLWGGPGSYKPKTKPIGKFGGPGVVVGGSIHRTQQVSHPGTEARKFEEVISADFKRDFSRIMNNAFKRIIRRL